jgi:murein DD-endopeptidase MepM/ murein hydrolase activator NlpD
MNRLSLSRRTQRTALFLATIALIATVANIYAAYQTTRPIVEGTWGYINQDNLYGVGDPHKGVDFPAALDTDLIAIADGVIQQVEENFQDGCAPPACPVFGNFILVRHTRQHYDRTTGQMAYVYSLYAHLSWQGAFVAPGNNVVAGQVIGDVDDTGRSTGNHLHLQIMIDSNANRTVTYPLTWTESNSRNPELWLRPYNGSTGTVVGKVTNTSGNPLGGVTVNGLQKAPAWGYGSSLTYIGGNNLNPDDILVENFATTDVTPGTYHVTTSLGGDLGWHTVRAGQITYVGLFPVWLPFVLSNSGGWNSTITVRNNNGTYTAQVNTTFFNTDGTVNAQRTNDTISFTGVNR